MSGFYMVKIKPKSRPYMAFYIEGLEHFWYVRMPFRLIGAPTAFTMVMVMHLHNLIMEEVLKIFVDNGDIANDTFNEMLNKLMKVLTHICKWRLLLSAAKSKLYMSEAVFMGARVGQWGVLPNLVKLTVIVDWKQPATTLNLASFLELTGHFRDLIKGYAWVEGPLRDLLATVLLPQPCTKSTYQRIMGRHKLEEWWKENHMKAFLDLKIAVMLEPILRGPRWDGMPFIITVDGCKDGFVGVLAQWSPHTKADGTVIHKLHPIAFMSKWMSPIEAKYTPFLLEFAALKFALDKFSDIIWGFPIEIEMDCQVLKDTLLSDKPSTVHT
jgi:hypothetical protein